ncbi:hypothetical protein BABINDRAFT_166143 [Babjeviella inositovora NRRL Y-12698]|uniref:Transcription elongation factor SPT4 n=1 Tax=Babjeviella inositovora NRRL Y-12698 TaxID=984486 RepID=A0A1E3QS51_9ASCO|nr:uncharacterized protein BABINDRAFT_166143 [Babjeviella inositovora NRRL Y-12698]ODQ80525.1 hypothetical protein BABINDRAFT_166143 [Babjeviella inositovora NRRL Y-12698]
MSSRTERACMLCGIIQTTQQFNDNGCPNCESILKIADEGYADVTSPAFEGLVAVGDPANSWVGKWLRINNFIPGMYAVKVNGKLPPSVVQDMEEQGLTYRPRDGSALD